MLGTILAIETSNPSAVAGGPDAAGGPGVAVATITADGLLNLRTEPLAATRRHDDDLIPAIDRLFRAANLRPKDLQAVAVSVGPGGYTALRVAIATAKLICESLAIPAIAVPSALVVARRFRNPGPFAVALSSKDRSTYVRTFDSPTSPRDEGRIIVASDVASLGAPTLVADSFLPVDVREAAVALGITIVPPEFDPAACLEVASTIEGIDPAALDAIYPRPPEAVTKWKELHGG